LIGKIVRHDGISVTLLVKRLRRQAREFPLKTGRHNYFAGGLRFGFCGEFEVGSSEVEIRALRQR
ncbi:MAG: hypothetical protein ACYC7E_16630, partial [Armatimonadota bacterium]